MERMKESLVLKPKPKRVIIETNTSLPLSSDSPSTAPSNNIPKSAQKHYWTPEEVSNY